MNIKNLLLRSISGIVYIGLIIGSIFWGVLPFKILMALFGIIATIELNNLLGDKENNRQLVLPRILDATGVVCIIFMGRLWAIYLWLFVFLIRLIAELYLHNDKPVKSLSQFFFSQIYIGFPLLCAALIGAHGIHLVLAIFLMIWINDTGAFIVGCSIGRHRLFERISPKKSWEGFFGGLIFNMGAATLFCVAGNNFWGFEPNILLWLGLAIIVTVFSTWGDLVESMFKRSLNVKDSGKIIPGHGGILDRIDSLLLVFPASFLYLLFIYGILLEIPV